MRQNVKAVSSKYKQSWKKRVRVAAVCIFHIYSGNREEKEAAAVNSSTFISSSSRRRNPCDDLACGSSRIDLNT